MKPKDKTTLLPQALLDKIKDTPGQNTPRSTCIMTNPCAADDDHKAVKRTQKRGPSRKDARKQDREAKKQRKAENHTIRKRPTETSAPPPLPVTQKRPAGAASSDQQGPRKKPRLSANPSDPVPSTLNAPKIDTSKLPHNPTAPKAKALTIDNLIKPKRDVAEREEAKKISWLESQLGIKKVSRNAKSRYGADFTEDGLDGTFALGR